MLIRLGILSALVVFPLLTPVEAQVPGAEQLKVGEFVTFILPEAGNHPEPRDPNVKFGVGGSANEQATDVLVYADGKTSTFAGAENNPSLCAGGTMQAAELIDPESKRPIRTINVITLHPNLAIPPQTRLEEIQVLSKCLDSAGTVYFMYMGTIRTIPGEPPSAGR
jgi:hypothetical protein